MSAANAKVDRLTRNTDRGEILLLHDADHYGVAGSWKSTAGALEPTLAALAEAGLRPLTLSEGRANAMTNVRTASVSPLDEIR